MRTQLDESSLEILGKTSQKLNYIIRAHLQLRLCIFCINLSIVNVTHVAAVYFTVDWGHLDYLVTALAKTTQLKAQDWSPVE